MAQTQTEILHENRKEGETLTQTKARLAVDDTEVDDTEVDDTKAEKKKKKKKKKAKKEEGK